MLNTVNLGNEKVERLVVLLYGNPGVGKTSLGLTSDSSLTLDFDHYSYRALHKEGKMGVVVKTWDQVDDIEASDFEGVSTVIIDTVGTCIESIIRDIEAKRPEMVTGGLPTLKGWQALRLAFNAWLNKIKAYDIDVIFVAHLLEESKGEETMDRIICQGGAKQDVYRQADLIGRISVDLKGRRTVSFNPTRTSLGKNCGIPDLVINPNETDTVAKIMERAKELINSRNAQANQEIERLKDLKDRLTEMDAEELTDQVTQMVDASKVDKNILMQVAKKKGLVLDKETMMFVEEAPNAETA